MMRVGELDDDRTHIMPSQIVVPPSPSSHIHLKAGALAPLPHTHTLVPLCIQVPLPHALLLPRAPPHT